MESDIFLDVWSERWQIYDQKQESRYQYQLHPLFFVFLPVTIGNRKLHVCRTSAKTQPIVFCFVFFVFDFVFVLFYDPVFSMWGPADKILIFTVITLWPCQVLVNIPTSTPKHLLDAQTVFWEMKEKERKALLLAVEGCISGICLLRGCLCSNNFGVIFAISLRNCFAPTVFCLNYNFEKKEQWQHEHSTFH